MDVAIREIDTHTKQLWIIAVVFFGVGDIATTFVGLASGHLVETGPVAAYLVDQFEVGILVGLKLAAFGGCLVLWRMTPGPSAVSVPFGLAIYGILITGWNTVLLLQSL